MKPQLTKAHREAVFAALGGSLRPWAQKCHQASIAVVKAKVFPMARVARGWAEGVSSQHSWIVVGPDCYDTHAMIIDPTIWSYRKDIKGLWVGTMLDEIHVPHGNGSIWEWGKPARGDGPTIKLTPKAPLSDAAKDFLQMIGPLDRTGWSNLANRAPVVGWPAGEIYAAMEKTKALSVLVPIDRIGMLTDINPGGLYL